MLCLKYVGAQANQLVCQETDGSLCADDRLGMLLVYYLPISGLVVLLSMLRNYKQISYLAKLALLATLFGLFSILADSL